ncbi:hypothetical protein BDZ89DRAFT_1114805 [Hymenopellis radicata]|nr:hypothetical protein BDZ89DRAFT_1114805 [Hymenopellis radicata]
MTLLVACTNMDHVFRSAFIGSASILFACVGFCLSAASALLGLFFPHIHERPPARAPHSEYALLHGNEGMTLWRRHQHDLVKHRPRHPHSISSFNLWPISSITPDSTQVADFNISGAVTDAPSDTRESSPQSLRSSTSSSGSSTLIPSPTASEFGQSQSNGGFHIGRSWTRKKVQSLSSPTDSKPGVKLSRVQTLLPSKASSKSVEPHVGISKAKSFCVAEKARKASLKPPVPRPRTQPYDAPYFAPPPISEAGLPQPTIRIVKPGRSSTLPPGKRRSSPNPTKRSSP